MNSPRPVAREEDESLYDEAEIKLGKDFILGFFRLKLGDDWPVMEVSEGTHGAVNTVNDMSMAILKAVKEIRSTLDDYPTKDTIKKFVRRANATPLEMFEQLFDTAIHDLTVSRLLVVGPGPGYVMSFPTTHNAQ